MTLPVAKPSVLAVFPEYTHRYEGKVTTMYVDVLGLVTVGAGCLIDSPDAAARLPFVHPSGTVAEPDEIRAAWRNLKANKDSLKTRHYKYAAPYTYGLRLPDAAVDDLMLERLASFVTHLRKTFTEWDSFPADAQLGILSLAWAAGSGFTAKFPRFTAAALRGDWAAAAEHGQLRTTGPDGTFNAGVVPRNAAQRWLFLAASVADSPTAPEGYADEVHWRAPA